MRSKKFFIFLIFIILISFVSANIFTDLWGKFTGKVIDVPNEFSESKNLAERETVLDESPKVEEDKEIVEGETEEQDVNEEFVEGEEKEFQLVSSHLKLNKKNYSVNELLKLI